MDPFSSQSSHGFEDRIRQMLSGDKPSVRLPPAPNTPQPSPPAGTPVFGHQTRVAMQSGHISAVNSPTQMHHPHLDPNPPAQHQAATNLQFQRHSPMQVPPLGPIRFENPQQHFLPPENGNLPRGQRVDPQHHRIPSIQHSGQFQRHQTHQQNGSHKHQRQQHSLDPENFSRSGVGRGQARPILFDANARPKQPAHMWHDGHQRQAQYLEQAVERHISAIDMSQAERDQKDIFRRSLEDVCHQLCEKNPQLPKVNLECFGSFASGFASAGSDMDLVIVVQNGESSSAVFSLLADDLPRSLEDALLRAGHGARLLSRTRVPIIKICQSPSESFLDKLREERYKWDLLPNEKKYPHLFKNEDNDAEDDLTLHMDQAKPVHEAATSTDDIKNSARTAASSSSAAVKKSPNKPRGVVDAPAQEHETTTETTVFSQDPPKSPQDSQKREQPRTWTRERKAGPLDFPKEGVGIQCDINFFNPLGLHNTQLLRCYSLCDARVRPIVLFVKAWAKLRRVNSSYSGTLSSYGYVLMVLHYLTNIAQPPVLTNLQLPWRPNARCTPQGATKTVVDGWTVDFWRNEDEIQAALHNREMSRNRQSIGSLLAGFFQYYSSMGGGPQFRWTQQVLSLRTPGGILTKDEKGWVKATTEEGDGKKIQHRYLFCIEDPFELAHNVARTVTHNGKYRGFFRWSFQF